MAYVERMYYVENGLFASWSCKEMLRLAIICTYDLCCWKLSRYIKRGVVYSFPFPFSLVYAMTICVVALNVCSIIELLQNNLCLQSADYKWRNTVRAVYLVQFSTILHGSKTWQILNAISYVKDYLWWK